MKSTKRRLEELHRDIAAWSAKGLSAKRIARIMSARLGIDYREIHILNILKKFNHPVPDSKTKNPSEKFGMGKKRDIIKPVPAG